MRVFPKKERLVLVSFLGLAWPMMMANLARADNPTESKTCSDKLRAAKRLIEGNENANVNAPFVDYKGIQECYDRTSLPPDAAPSKLERNLDLIATNVDQLYAAKDSGPTKTLNTITKDLSSGKYPGGICNAAPAVQSQVKSIDSWMQGTFGPALLDQGNNLRKIKSLFKSSYVDAKTKPTTAYVGRILVETGTCDKAVDKNKKIQAQLNDAQAACDAIFAQSKTSSESIHKLSASLNQCP